MLTIAELIEAAKCFPCIPKPLRIPVEICREVTYIAETPPVPAGGLMLGNPDTEIVFGDPGTGVVFGIPST